MLVTVEADAVTEAMSKELVIGAKTSRNDDRASSIIDRAGQFSGSGRVESGVLGTANDFKDLLNLGGRFAKDASARDVGIVAFHFCTPIDENHVAFLKFLRLLAAVRKGGGWTDQDEGIATQIHFRE